MQIKIHGGGDNLMKKDSSASMEDISRELVKLGISLQFVSKNSPMSTGENKTQFDSTIKSCVYLITPEKKIQPKNDFEKHGNSKGYYNPFLFSKSNSKFYSDWFKSIIWYFNFINIDDEVSLPKLNMAKRMANYGRHSYIRGSILPKIEKNIEQKERQEEICSGSAYDCTANPKDSIYAGSQIMKTSKVYYGKYQPPDTTKIPGYYDVAYLNDKVDLLGDDYDDRDPVNAICDSIDSCSQIADQCFYYVYYPNINYDSCGLPVVFLFHAGGFSDCRHLNYEDALCRMIAKKGFIVFNIEYRRGRIKDKKNNGKFTSVQQQLAIYRAMQDGRGALRTAIFDQQNIATNGIPYRFDTTQIYVAGQSAGGLIAGSLAYYTAQSQIDSIFPSPTGSGFHTISDELGPIDADLYRGDTSFDFHSGIKALWCMWGGFGIPIPVSNANDQYNFLSINGTVPLVPMIAFMGALDPVFSPLPAKQNVFFPPSTGHAAYVIESSCLINPSYIIYGNGTNSDLRMECTNDLYKILKDNGVPTIIYIDCKMYHGLEKPDPKTAPITTNFGITSIMNTTLDDVNNYMASRFAFFARAIYRGDAPYLSGTSKFTNCEDFRYQCNRLASNDGCNANDNCQDTTSDDQ